MLATNSTSALREAADSLGSKSANTPSWVSSVVRWFRSQPYSPCQKKVWPSGMRSTSSVLIPRPRRISSSASPKSSPTGPTTCTSSKNDAASAKWTAEPPSIRSRLPNGVFTASNAIDPTTVNDMRRGRVARHRRPRSASVRVGQTDRAPEGGCSVDSSNIDGLLRGAVENGAVPGVVAVAGDRDGTLYEGAFGHLGVADDRPARPDTVFLIASMTKAIASVAALQLIEQGRLTLEQPVADVIT